MAIGTLLYQWELLPFPYFRPLCWLWGIPLVVVAHRHLALTPCARTLYSGEPWRFSDMTSTPNEAAGIPQFMPVISTMIGFACFI